MQITLLHGYPDGIGRRKAFVGTGNGPASYTGGNSPTDVLGGLPYQFYIDAITEISISQSGTYYAMAQPTTVPIAAAGQAWLQNPRTTWSIRYFTSSNGAEVNNGTNLSAEKFVVSGFGGNY